MSTTQNSKVTEFVSPSELFQNFRPVINFGDLEIPKFDERQSEFVDLQSVRDFFGNENIRPSTDGDELEDLYYDLCGDG